MTATTGEGEQVERERSVLVTGAGRGIGREVAERFAALGWRVGAYDVDPTGVEELAAAHPGVVAGRLDVTDPAAWQACLAQFGELDVLVNNAGILVAGEFTELPVETQARVVDVNVKGVLYGCSAAFPHLRRPGGTVVNLASASALYGQPGLATYSATKSAVCALTEALDLEWQRHGLRVVDVLPLFVETAMGRQVAALPTARTLGVRLTPAHVADAVVAAALAPRQRVRGPHRAVGAQARALALSSHVAPTAVTRRFVAMLARPHQLAAAAPGKGEAMTDSPNAPHQPSGPGATGGLPGSGSDTPDGTGFADGSTLAADESAATVDEADVAPTGGDEG